MAYFHDARIVKQTGYADPFIPEYKPGEPAPLSGIYRCTGCGLEIAHNGREPLPPQNHGQHPGAAAIRWKLVVFTETGN